MKKKEKPKELVTVELTSLFNDFYDGMLDSALPWRRMTSTTLPKGETFCDMFLTRPEHLLVEPKKNDSRLYYTKDIFLGVYPEIYWMYYTTYFDLETKELNYVFDTQPENPVLDTYHPGSLFNGENRSKHKYSRFIHTNWFLDNTLKDLKESFGQDFTYNKDQNIWKIESRKIFEEVGSPVFISGTDYKTEIIKNPKLLEIKLPHRIETVNRKGKDVKEIRFVEKTFSLPESLVTYLFSNFIGERISEFLTSANDGPYPKEDNKTTIARLGFEDKVSFIGNQKPKTRKGKI